jgi:hypothetical protein
VWLRSRRLRSRDNAAGKIKLEESIMRVSRSVPIVISVIVACAAAIVPDHAQAIPLNDAQGVHASSETLNYVQRTACWRYGWHGWGLYRFCAPPPVIAEPAWAWEPACRDITVRERRGAETVVRHIHRCD